MAQREQSTPQTSPAQLLEATIGFVFSDPAVLERALAHRSYCAEHADVLSNERLEFLGDSVLGLAVTEYVFRTNPQLPEGELAKVRASVVNAETLAEVAGEIELGAALLLGRGEDASGGRDKPSILADGLEALIAAVYLDGGYECAAALVLQLLRTRIDEGATGPGGHDYKTRLQELVAQRFDQLPRYRVRHEGPDHSKRFFATVRVAGEIQGTGEGRSKKQAEQVAARAAWFHLRESDAAGASDVTEDRASSSGDRNA